MQLDKTKQTRLNVLEQKIAAAMATMRSSSLEAAQHLNTIKEERLYLATHKSFAAYCEGVWKVSEQHAHRMLNAFEIVDALPAKANQLVSNEAQARALGAAPKKDRARIVESVAATGTVTAARITEATNQLVSPKHVAKIEDATEMDQTGIEIPADILSDWHRAQDVSGDMLTHLKAVNKSLSDALSDKRDLVFAELDNVEISTTKKLISQVKRVEPYAVCTSCQGHARSTCTLCKKRGFLSKYAYDNFTTVEQRAMRAKRAKK